MMTSSVQEQGSFVTCLFCRAEVDFNGTPATEYEKHLEKYHDILYEREEIVTRTLENSWLAGEQKHFSAGAIGVATSCQVDLVPFSPLRFVDKKEESPPSSPAPPVVINIMRLKKDKAASDAKNCITNREPREIVEPLKCDSEESENDEKDDEDAVEYIQNNEEDDEYEIEDEEEVDEEEEEDEVEEDDEEEEEDEENGDEDEEKEDKAVKTLDRRLWYQGIEYECQICFHMMFDGNSIVKHIQKRHKMTMKLYVHQFKSLSSKECVYECQICHESVKHSKAPIARHLKDQHGMEIDVYEMLYEATTSKCQANSSASVTTGPARRPQRTRSKTTGESDSEEAGKEEELVELLSEHLIDDAIMDENGLEENFQCLDFDTETNARYRAWWNTTDRYDCRICEQKFFAPSNLANHYRKHLLSKNEYLERYGTLKTHSSDFQCHECKTTIPFIRHKVVHHLRNHDQSPADYFKYFLNTELLVKNREFHSWLLGCEFSCRVCNKKCMNDVSLSKHIKSEHGISGLGEYERLHGHRMSKVVKRSCAICKELIEWYPSKIARHLFSNHELTLTKYFYFHVKDNHQRIYDESKSETWHNSETQEAADGEAYRLSVSRTSSKIGERVFQCQICEKKARGPTLFQKHLKAKHLDLQEQPDFGEVSESNGVPVHYLKRYKTKFQWNQCKRFCPICDKEFNNYNAIYKHVTKVHKQTCTELKTNEKDILIKHTCLLCGSALRFEDKVFRWHLKKTHQTTIEDYEELFHSELEDVFESLEPSDALDVTVAPSPRFPWNQSKRYCTICLKVSTSLSTHMKHVSTIHDKSFRDLKPSKKDVIVSHLCFLCDDKIRFELVDIKRHMTVKHEITLVDYECQFSTVLKAVFSIFESGSPKRASKVPTIINNIEDEADNNCIEVVPPSPTCNDDIQFETVKVEDLDENNTEIPDTKNVVSIFEETTASRVAENVINEFDGMIKVEYDHEGL